MSEITEIKKILNMALYAGTIMLENGAETYRVEETIQHICKSKNLEKVEIFVIPTGIFISLNYNDNLFSYIKRIKKNKIDLHIIALVNDFSRNYCANPIETSKALEQLKNISNAPDFSLLTKCFFGGISGGFFTLMFKGNLYEFLLAFIISSFVIWISSTIDKYTQSFFLENIIGGICNTTLTLLLAAFFKKFNIIIDINKIIIGAIMPLVPGVAFTNAIRDSINGDLVSGNSKLLEATIIATAIAIGVGFTLNINLLLQGGL